MRPVKHVLLGSAAGIFAVAGAQAADLPVKAKPVEYVKVCSLYGAGFWYVPGTDTCIKIGAYIKLQTEYNATNTPFMRGRNGDAGGRSTRTDTSQFTFNNRGVISFDMRTQTEYGTLRSYIDIGEQTAASDNFGGATSATSALSVFASRAFLQFAGFTAGRMRSFFDMYFQGTFAFSGQQFGGDTSPNGIIGGAYTWQFGGGLSASVSLEDGGQGNGARGRSTVNAALPITTNATTGAITAFGALGVGTPTTDNKGTEFFDPVFNLRLDQAWGFVGVSAAAHDASGGYFMTAEGSGHPGDKWGYAVSPAALWNNPFGLQGDAIAAQGVYSKGAVGYATPLVGGQALFNAGRELGLGWLFDGIYTPGSSIELTTVWSVNSGYEHRWNPQWRTSVYGGFLGVEFSDTAKGMICNKALGNSFQLNRGSSCDPNFSMSGVGSRTLWNPVPDLDVGLDVVWWHMNTAFRDQTATLTAQGAKPSGSFTLRDQDALSAIFRVQRNFLY